VNHRIDWSAQPDRLHDATDAVTKVLYSRAARDVLAGFPVHVSDDHPDPWVRARMDEFVAALEAGRVRLCVHLLGGPQPCVTTAWQPRLLCCVACAALGVFHLEGEEDNRCDRCGRFAGLPPTGGIHQAVATFGPIQFVYGFCEPCYQTAIAYHDVPGARGES
jgi:hypothetical protein